MLGSWGHVGIKMGFKPTYGNFQFFNFMKLHKSFAVRLVSRVTLSRIKEEQDRLLNRPLEIKVLKIA